MTVRRRSTRVTPPFAAAVLVAAFGLSATHFASAAAGSHEPTYKLTPVGNRLAAAALLKHSDLGDGWSKPSGSKGSGPTCDTVLQADESGLVETGTAASPVFTRGKTEAITQTARTFSTEGGALTAWTSTVGNKLVLCMEQEVENTSSMSAPVSVTAWYRLDLPRPTDGHDTGYRVVAKAKTNTKSWAKVYFDEIVVTRGKALTEIVLSSLNSPLPATLEQRLAKVVSRRLA